MKKSTFSHYFAFIKKKYVEKKNMPFFKGGLGSLVIKFGNILLQFGVGVALARTLGVEAFGIYTFVFAVIKILAIPTELGLPNLLIRFIAQYHVQKNWKKIKGLLKFTTIAVIIISTVVISFTLISVNTGVLDLAIDKRETFMWGLALLPILALGSIRGASLRGLRYIILGLIPESLLRHAFFLGLLFIFFKLNDGNLSAAQSMSYQFFAALGAYLVGAFLLLKFLPTEAKKAKPKYELKKWIKVALPFLIIGGIQIIMGRIDVVILGILRTPIEVGIYEVAYKVAGLVFFSLSAITFVVGPYFSRYYSNNDVENLQKIATFSVLFSSIIAVLIALLLTMFGELFLGLIFGEEFQSSYKPMVILIIAQLYTVMVGSVATLLNMAGLERKVLVTMLLACIVNIALNLIFIPLIGVEGAALTSLITILFWKTYLLHTSIKELDVDTSILSIFKYYKI